MINMTNLFSYSNISIEILATYQNILICSYFQETYICHQNNMCACSVDDFETFYCCARPPPWDGCVNLVAPHTLSEGFCEAFNNIKCDARCPDNQHGCCRCDANNSSLSTLPPPITPTPTTPAPAPPPTTTPPPPPPPPPPTIPAPPQSISDCPNCICTNIYFGSYGSPFADDENKFCCSRSHAPQLQVYFDVLTAALSCPQHCYAHCGNTFHCCTDPPPTPPPTTPPPPPPPQQQHLLLHHQLQQQQLQQQLQVLLLHHQEGVEVASHSSGNVLLENGKSVTISELQAGHRVQTGKTFHMKGYI